MRDRLLERFSAIEDAYASRGPLWLQKLRLDAKHLFEDVGLPTTRLEEWNATNVAAIAEGQFKFADAPEISDHVTRALDSAFADLELGRLVFVDGQYSEELSDLRDLPPGAWAGSLAQALSKSPERIEKTLGKYAGRKKDAASAFTAVNTMLFADGAAVMIDNGVIVERPIHVVHVVNDGAAAFPRTLLIVGDNAKAEVVETFVSAGHAASFTCAVTEYSVGDNGRLRHTRVQDESTAAFHVFENMGQLGRDAHYENLNGCFGAKIARGDLGAVLNGEGGEAHINGVYVCREDQHVDNQTVLDHAVPNCESHELYKGVLSDHARAVFNGRIIVRQDAQQTNAFQSNRNLLLSDDAVVNTRPQLEIYADDVKCSHGATIGRLQDEAMFYLRSRGIAEPEARHMLIQAFAGDVIEDVSIVLLKAAMEDVIRTRVPLGA